MRTIGLEVSDICELNDMLAKVLAVHDTMGDLIDRAQKAEAVMDPTIKEHFELMKYIHILFRSTHDMTVSFAESKLLLKVALLAAVETDKENNNTDLASAPSPSSTVH